MDIVKLPDGSDVPAGDVRSVSAVVPDTRAAYSRLSEYSVWFSEACFGILLMGGWATRTSCVFGCCAPLLALWIRYRRTRAPSITIRLITGKKLVFKTVTSQEALLMVKGMC